MNIDVVRHDCLRLSLREYHNQRQLQQNDEEEVEERQDLGAPSRQRPSVDLSRRAAIDIPSKCTCHDECQEREELLSREIEKLREALEALRRESDKEVAYLKDQLLATSSRIGIASKSPARTANAPGGFIVNSVSCLPPRSTSVASTMTSACTALSPTLMSVSGSGGPPSTHTLHRVAVDQSSKNSMVVPSRSLFKIPGRDSRGVAHRVLAAFQSPPCGPGTTEPNLQPNAAYFYSLSFCDDMGELAALAGACLQLEPRCHALSSPVYVFGDLHGNLQDLSFFARRIWQSLGVDLTAGSLLFLGDFVDRGAMSLEVVAYLFALKMLSPSKVFLLRGNHETRAVNGLEEIYGSACLLAQCRARFGEQRGRKLWDQVNSAFDRLPLAATIDNDVFCVHGGIPRPVPTSSASPIAARIADIQRLPHVAPLDLLPATSDTKHSSSPTLQQKLAMVSEMLWADPARSLIGDAERDDEESAGLNAFGFGRSARGGAAITFGARAVTNFLAANGLSRIIRAHEAAVDGITLSMGARVLTLFSTSADHGLGADATCACALVENQQIRVMNRGKPDLQPRQTAPATPCRTSGPEAPRQRRRSVTLGFSGGDGRSLLSQERHQQLYEASRELPAASMVMDRIAGGLCPQGVGAGSGVSVAGHDLVSLSRDSGDDTDGEDSDEIEQVGSEAHTTGSADAQDNNQAEDG